MTIEPSNPSYDLESKDPTATAQSLLHQIFQISWEDAGQLSQHYIQQFMLQALCGDKLRAQSTLGISKTSSHENHTKLTVSLLFRVWPLPTDIRISGYNVPSVSDNASQVFGHAFNLSLPLEIHIHAGKANLFEEAVRLLCSQVYDVHKVIFYGSAQVAIIYVNEARL